MFRRKGENLHSIYILLFLNIAFFLLEYQDGKHYASLFAFDGAAVRAGQVWRVFTYQFSQAGQAWFVSFPRPLVLFFSLLLLYFMGAMVEEEWGTRHFLTFFTISTVVTAGMGWLLGVPLLGSFFINFSLLFVFASIYRGPAFYIRWLAYLDLTWLVFGALFGKPSNIAALSGAAAGYIYFLMTRQREAPEPKSQRMNPADATAIRNAARFVGMRKAVVAGSRTEIDRLIVQSERDIVRGVNVCPPADFKPENSDGYCIRCEGFAECSARYLRLHRPPEPAADAPAALVPASER
jgi:membrane associated rhomboid family serine protease